MYGGSVDMFSLNYSDYATSKSTNTHTAAEELLYY